MKLIASLTLILALAGCQPIRQIACVPSAESRMFLEDLAAGGAESELERKTAPPRRSLVTYRVEGRPGEGELYEPVDGASAGVVLVPGAAEAGREDPRMVSFARALARSGFAVLVPELANVRRFQLRPADARAVADAFVYLAGRPALAPEGRVGFAGISYAVGPAVIAALEPDVRDRVRFVLGVGPYYDLGNTITYFTTGYHREPGGAWRHQAPLDYGKWAFIAGNLDRFEHEGDRRLLKAWSERLLADPAAVDEDLASGLETPEARALHALMRNRDPEAVPGLIAQLPASVRADLEGLDLASRDLSGLKARMIIVHGYDDRLVPYTESLRLARALPADRTRLFLVNGLDHVDFERPGFLDLWGLGCAVNALLDERRR